MKFLAIVMVCGIYQGHNRVCLDWTDNNWHSTRAQCMVRAKEIVKEVKTLTWYAGVKLETYPVPRCRSKPKE